MKLPRPYYKIRLTHDLIRELKRAAKRNKQSVNKEITDRIFRSTVSDRFFEIVDADTITWKRK